MAISFDRKFDETTTFDGYSMVYKDIKLISETGQGKALLQIESTAGLTNEIISKLPNNIDIRVIGGYTQDYMDGHKSPLTPSRQAATYTKGEMIQILDKMDKIESKIELEWDKKQRAHYLFECLRKGLEYQTPKERGTGNRHRQFDSLIGLLTKVSTCAGYSHIYQELCTRQGIKCHSIGGYYGKQSSQHAWNLLEIDGKNFLVDLTQDLFDANCSKSGFGVPNGSPHKPRNCIKEHSNLSTFELQSMTEERNV